MTAPARAASSWLALREEADSRSRSTDLVRGVVTRLPATGVVLVHDLGCGTGSMGRWLAPRLPRPQHWVLHDRDADLLREAAGRPGTVADGSPATAAVSCGDLADLTAADLAGAGLVTASALLDVLTADDLERLMDLCTAAGCPALITLSVTGHVELEPADPLDCAIRDAFNAHQRRVTNRGRLLGPDAVDAAAEGFRRRGADVIARPSPWRLGTRDAALTQQWLDGWVRDACEQDPGLIQRAAPYLLRRTASARDGRLTVTVHHSDLLAVPR